MKVLRITRSMDPAQGGVVEAVNQAASSFNNKKYQMDVLTLDNPGSSWVLSNKNYKIHALGEGKTAYGFHSSYLSWLWKNAEKYDVVIIDGLWQFLVIGGYILKFLKVPYCVFTHGMLDPYFNEDKLKYLKKLPFWFLSERNVISMADAVIFTCQEEAILAAESFPWYRACVKIATLGVEGNPRSEHYLSKVFLEEHSLLKTKRFALFLSRINKKKGIDLLIEALGQLKNLPTDFVLAIAGPDSNGLQVKLTKQISSLGLTHRVVWLGMLGADIKWGAYHAAELFILPSHQENFGIVVAEALSTATPVLITNKVNIWREIEASGAGFVENDTVVGLVNLLNKWFLLSDEDKNIMGKKARACFENNFSLESSAIELEQALQSAITHKFIGK